MKPMKDLLQSLFKDHRALAEEGDYIDKEGLLVCGRCGERREFLQDMWDTPGLEGKEPRYVVRPKWCLCQTKAAEAEENRRKIEADQRKRERNRARCFDVEGMEECTFAGDDGSNAEQSAICHRFVDNFEAASAKGQGLLMWGDAGTGKTFLAGCIANALLEEGYKVKATSLAFLNGKITEEYGNSSHIIKGLMEYDLVIFDDLGTERKTSTANENAFQIIDALEKRGVSMVFTTNIPAREMAAEKDRSNVRIYSRIMGKCMPIKFEGIDKRKAGAGEEWAF